MKRLNNLYDQITPKTTPEELSRKVMDSEIRMTKKKRPSKAVAALLAATVGVSALTVTAGAANGWDYAGMFRNLFGDKSENLMENIVPEATVLQDTIDTMNFELVAAAADKHGVLAILDIYPENGYKLIEYDEYGNEIIRPFQDLFISINSDAMGGSGVGCDVIEASEEKVRLSVRMNTENMIKGEKVTVSAWKAYRESENTEIQLDLRNNEAWIAEIEAEYSAEELVYDTETTAVGEDHYGKPVSMTVTQFEVSPISLNIKGEGIGDFLGVYWSGDSYVINENGEKTEIGQISVHSDEEANEKEMVNLGFEEPVSPEEICAVEFDGKVIEIK